MTRRDILKSALFLPLASTLLPQKIDAQEGQNDLVIAEGPHLSYFGIRPFFVRSSNTRFNGYEKEGDLTPVFDFGVKPYAFRKLVDAVAVRVYRLAHDPQRPIEKTVALFDSYVAEELKKNEVEKPSLFLKQWLMCEAICAYVTSKVAYDFEIVEKTVGKGDALERYRWQQQSPEIVYGLHRPAATCDGFGRLTEKIAELSGIKCFGVGGTMRSSRDGEAAPTPEGHGWVVFELDGGVRIPTDTTVPWLQRADYTKIQQKNGWCTMPATLRQWELFCALYFINPEAIFFKGQKASEKLSLVSLTFEQWRSLNAKFHVAARDWLDTMASEDVGQSWNIAPTTFDEIDSRLERWGKTQ